MYPKTFIAALFLAPSAMGLALPAFMRSAEAPGLEARDVAFRAEAARLSHREPAPVPHVVEIPQVEARNLTSRDLANVTVSSIPMEKRANLTLSMEKRTNVTVLDRHLHRPTEDRA